MPSRSCSWTLHPPQTLIIQASTAPMLPRGARAGLHAGGRRCGRRTIDVHAMLPCAPLLQTSASSYSSISGSSVSMSASAGASYGLASGEVSYDESKADVQVRGAITCVMTRAAPFGLRTGSVGEAHGEVLGGSALLHT